MFNYNKTKKMGLYLLVLIFAFTIPALAAMISVKQEIQIGKSSSQQIEKKYGLVQNVRLAAQIDNLGQSLVKHGERGIPYSFKVLNQDVINAFAFPGGYIYVTKGICKVMSLNQLSFVLGHEITHVEKRHSVKTLERSMMGQLGGALLTSLIRGGNRNQISNLVGMTNFVISNRYSQSQEKEADSGGTVLMCKAGYDPGYGVEALQILKKNDSGKGDSQFMNSLLSTHPLTQDRIEDIQDRVEGLRAEYGLSEHNKGQSPSVL
ncbi:MAG: M48 family metalloprotease [Candidatus Bruticola sp.]